MSDGAKEHPTLDDIEAQADEQGQDYYDFLAEWATARRRDA